MKIRISYKPNPETGINEVIGFANLPPEHAREEDNMENQILIDATDVGDDFQIRWFDYAVEGTTVSLNPDLVSKNSKH